MNVAIPEALHICPGCSDEIVDGESDLCFLCGLVHRRTVRLVQLVPPPPPLPQRSSVQPEVTPGLRRLCGRLLLLTAAVNLFFFGLPYLIRAVFWAERLLGK